MYRFEIVLAVIVALGVFVVGVGTYRWLRAHPCVSSHIERRGEWIQLMPVGQVLVPIFHEAEDVAVCDQRR